MLTRQKMYFVFICIISGIIFFSRISSFAQEETQPKTAQGKAVPLESGQVEKAEVGSYVTEKAMPSYNLSLKQIIEEAKKNIKKVDEKIREGEIFKRNQEREIKIRQYFDQGNLLFEQGKLKKARENWDKVLQIINEPEMKDYIQKEEKTAVLQELLQKQQEALKQKEEEAKQKEEELARQKEEQEQERLEKQRQKEEEAKQKAEEKRLAQDKKKKINALYEQGVAYFNNNEFNAAEAQFKEILSIDPEQTKAIGYLETRIPDKIALLQADNAREQERLEKQRQKEEEAKQKEEQAQQMKQQKEEELAKQKAEQEQVKLEKQRQKEEELAKQKQQKEQERLQKQRKEEEQAKQKQQEEQERLSEKQQKEQERLLEKQRKEEERIRQKQQKEQERLEKQRQKEEE
ncbi:MAG: hypothetical protein QMD94_01040 [Candidatus Omnitrophota bacterium]|nr:hypothetical protein [Candidatus Omnitrophota bacterium]